MNRFDMIILGAKPIIGAKPITDCHGFRFDLEYELNGNLYGQPEGEWEADLVRIQIG
jgi:hypothetical protein